ncbi:hypothetical protein ACQR0Z_20970 [Bradyrhizobium sp. HKCCYLS3077]|uniref:hypothetical protein n=1 Tax=Bradyrhizobium sp. HKCCYLS3077 TaxID=3420761 RepID=UPI003EB7940F
MPILRYFLFVGGALLALLVLADSVLPSVPLPTTLTSASELPPVRIQSTRKWPERIVMDTAAVVPASASEKLAKVEQHAQPAAAVEPAKSSARDAYAQMTPAEVRPQAVAPKSAEKLHAAKLSEAVKTTDSKKRKVAKAPGRPMILVAQQPHSGLFDSTW